MSWFIKFIDSSIGKKLVMAVTGIFLAFYLIIHLVANLFLLKNDGGKTFNDYAEFMASTNNIPVRIIEIVLFAAFIYHIINGIRLWWNNRNARKQDFKIKNRSENSSFYSRFMVHSGIIVFVFLVIHLRTFFIPTRFGSAEENLYKMAAEAFLNPVYSWFYVIAMVLLAFHLVHGVQSAFQTFGIRNNRYTPLIKNIGVIFAIVICAGFALIPLYFLFGGGN